MSNNSSRRLFDKWEKRVKFLRSEHPFGPLKEIRNEDGNLHCDDGPAYISPTRCIWYKNGRRHGIDVGVFGSTTFYFENIMVPRHFIYDPESITFEEVMNYRNQEVKYAAIQLYGFDRMLEEDRFNIVDKSSETGNLLLEVGNVFSDPIRIVAVKNGTPEPNGTYKRYFLAVPPHIHDADEAVAWTFRRTKDEYAPAQET